MHVAPCGCAVGPGLWSTAKLKSPAIGSVGPSSAVGIAIALIHIEKTYGHPTEPKEFGTRFGKGWVRQEFGELGGAQASKGKHVFRGRDKVRYLGSCG